MFKSILIIIIYVYKTFIASALINYKLYAGIDDLDVFGIHLFCEKHILHKYLIGHKELFINIQLL